MAAELAALEGVVDLCYEMAGEDLKIISAGGTSDGRIGTDPMLIKESIEKAYDGDGVVILADIGSSIMSSELAVEMLDEEIKKAAEEARNTRKIS